MQRWVVDNADRIARTIVGETGKAYEDAMLAEVMYGAAAFGFWAKRAPRWVGDRRVRSSAPAVLGKRLLVRYEPLGVVGVIGPWNYPLTNSFGDAIPALAAGNAVILKPSEHTPMTSLLLAEGLAASGVPDGVFAVATGAGPTAEALVDLVDMVQFTGSTATGRAVAVRAAERLIPVSLELGGKDPMIVLADADLGRAANAAVYYAMQNAGQTCISVERVYVEDAVHDEFVRLLAERVASLRQGDPRGGPGTVDVGAMTTPAQVDLVAEHVRDAVTRGATVVAGGERDGAFFPPTVLTDVDHSMLAMREETFGPTLPVMRVRDAEEAIRLANDSDYGLAASVFTGDAGPRRGDRAPAARRRGHRQRRAHQLPGARAADGRVEELRAWEPATARAASASSAPSRRSSCRAGTCAATSTCTRTAGAARRRCSGRCVSSTAAAAAETRRAARRRLDGPVVGRVDYGCRSPVTRSRPVTVVIVLLNENAGLKAFGIGSELVS